MNAEDEMEVVKKALEAAKAVMPPKIRDAHACSRRNREKIKQSESCGCFFCAAIFSPSDIQSWTDGEQTAICPKCGVDSVLPSAAGFPISRPFLEQMNKHWF